MCEKEAVIEYIKHFAANMAVGILNFFLGFGIALIMGAVIPVQVPIESLYELVRFSFVIGVGSGIVGSVLAVESDGKFKATKVIDFIREEVYPEERNNGASYTLCSRCNLTIHRKKSWQDYILYF